MSIKAVAFDIDGTLYPNFLMYVYSIPFFLAYPRFLFHFGKVRRKVRKIRPIRDFRTVQASLLAAEMGIEEEKASALIDKTIYRRWERCFRGMILHPGIKHLLSELKARGLKLAVLSDFPVGKKLEYFRLAKYFDYALSSESSAYLKPNPEPFLALAGVLGFPPGEILFVGNSKRYDIAGASKIGMKTAYIGVKRGEKICADIKFLWYKELRSILGEEQWNSR
jgi:putative hydrolase of the HAD superfamily